MLVRVTREKNYTMKSSTNENWKKEKENTQKYRSGRLHSNWYIV